MRRIPQSVAQSRFSHDKFLRARGDRASAAMRDLVEMTQLVIAHVARNREVDRRMRAVSAVGVKPPSAVQASS
jgi:hypothetical protein